MLEACTEAAKPARCVAASSLSDGEIDIVAIVSWDDAGAVRIELGRRERGDGRWRQRRLKFAEKDPVEERWRAAGIAIGTLAMLDQAPDAEPPSPTKNEPTPAGSTESEPGVVPSEPPANATSSEDTDVPTAVNAAPRPARWSLDLAAVGGPGLDRTLRYGASATLAHLSPPGGLDAGVRIDATFGSLSSAPDREPAFELSTTWWTVGASLGTSWEIGTQRFGVAAGPFIDWMSVEANGSNAEVSRVLPGARAGFELRKELRSALGLLVAGDVGLRAGVTHVALDGVEVATRDLFAGNLRLGLTLDL